MKYIALRNLCTQSGKYGEGDEVELSEGEAKELLLGGVIEEKIKPFSGWVSRLEPAKGMKDGALKSLFLAIGKAGSAVVKKIHEADSQIAELNAERSLLTDTPVSLEDFMSYVRADISRRGKQYERTLVNWQNKWFQNVFLRWERAERDGVPQGIPYLNAEHPHGGWEMTPGAVYFLFGDLSAERFSEALKVLKWPDNAVPVEQRRARILAIDAELDRLTAYRDELVQELSAVGMTG